MSEKSQKAFEKSGYVLCQSDMVEKLFTQQKALSAKIDALSKEINKEESLLTKQEKLMSLHHLQGELSALKHFLSEVYQLVPKNPSPHQ